MKAKKLLFVLSTLCLLQTPTLLRATTLGSAVNATNLVWTTGGTGGVGWFYLAGSGIGNDSFDGIASAQSGHVGNNGESWLQTTVVGPGTLSFWWQAYSEPSADWLEFYINDAQQSRISGLGDEWSSWPSGWEYHSYQLPAGTNVLKWRYVKDGSLTGGTLDCAYLDRVSFVTSAPRPLQQALNTCGVTWDSTGSLYPNGWLAQTNVTHDGNWAAQSGAVWHDQTNSLQTTIVGATNVSFWWKVSSQTNADFLLFYTNGVLAKKISGEVNWQSNFFKLPASKTNVLEWRYVKDGGIIPGSDCGWLHHVMFNPAFKAMPYTLQPPTRLPDGRIQLGIAGEVGCPCRVEFSTNLADGNWSSLTNLTTTGDTTLVIDAASPNSPLRFYRTASP